MRKSVIAVDIDEVLLPLYPLLFRWYNREYGTRLTLADNESKDLALWGTQTEEEAIRRVHRFFDTAIFRNAQPFREAKHAIRHLSERFTIVAITARDTLIEEVTREWLDEHFSELIHEAHFTAKYSLEGGARKKIDVCREVGATHLVDDNLQNCLEVAESGLQAVLFGEYPWNVAPSLPKRVIRCKEWAEVVEYFNAQ